MYRDSLLSRIVQANEESIHADFELNCGPLYVKKLNSWEILFEMRYAGIPTRLLDWTENFGSALYFALKGVNWNYNKESKKPIKPCVWIMNPFYLNKKFCGNDVLYLVDNLGFDYEDSIKPNKEKMNVKLKIEGPIAILPPRLHQRSFAQKSVYTLHVINYQSREEICRPCVNKFEIPLNSIDEAYKFLKLSGINEYSLFPDPDGLGRHLIQEYMDIGHISLKK